MLVLVRKQYSAVRAGEEGPLPITASRGVLLAFISKECPLPPLPTSAKRSLVASDGHRSLLAAKGGFPLAPISGGRCLALASGGMPLPTNRGEG